MKSTRSISKAQKGWVYGVIAIDGTLGYFDPMYLPITINNESVTVNDLINRLVKYEEDDRQLTIKLNSLKSTLKSFLDKAGYNLPSESLNDIIQGINGVDVLNPNDKTQVALLVDGYISEVVDIKIEQLLRNQQVPSDIGLGYHKVEHGKIVEDLKRKEETLMTD